MIEWVGETYRANPPHPSAPAPFTHPPCPPGMSWDAGAGACRHFGYRANPPHPSAPAPFVFGAQPTHPPRSPSPAEAQQPVRPPHAAPHSAPPPFPCPQGTSWNGTECAPMRHLGLSIPPAVQQAHAKAILVAWNAQHQVVADYGVADVANPAWTERDGRVLHAFAQWWTGTPQLNPSADQADAFGVVVAQPTPLHVAALDNWFASQGQQVPGVQAADIAASKALLVLWSKTDGTAPSNYGLDPSEFAPAWTTRDTAELALFQAWWNAQGKPAVGTNGALDVASSNALKAWFAERAAAAPSGWVAPAAQPQNAPATPACPPGKLWDEVNQACQPLPAGVSVPGEPPAKSNAVWWVLGGLAVVGAGAFLLSSKSVGAAMAPVRENPAGYYVRVRGGNNETYGPYPTLQRAKTFARIGATKGAHDRVVLKGGKVVRHYRAGTGESLVHENRS